MTVLREASSVNREPDVGTLGLGFCHRSSLRRQVGPMAKPSGIGAATIATGPGPRTGAMDPDPGEP